jgi:thiol-disulfide isomerase/thioredoxin
MLTKRALLRCVRWAVILTVSVAFAQSVHREIVIEDDREPAPRFHAKTLAGEQFSNDSTKGKVVLFQFWTTWCPYCKSEEGLVNDLTAEFAGKGLVVIAVDVAESKKVVQQYLKDHPPQVSHRDDRRYQSGRDVCREPLSHLRRSRSGWQDRQYATRSRWRAGAAQVAGAGWARGQGVGVVHVDESRVGLSLRAAAELRSAWTGEDARRSTKAGRPPAGGLLHSERMRSSC